MSQLSGFAARISDARLPCKYTFVFVNEELFKLNGCPY